MKQCLQSVNHKQFPIQMAQNNKHNRWLEILNFQPKLLWRTPTKILCERRRRRQQEAARKAQRTSLSTVKATSSTQRPQTCTEGATKYYNYTAKPMKRGNTDCQSFKKRWGNEATLTLYSKIIRRCNDRQQKLQDLYNARQEYMYLSNGLRTAYQPLHHEQHWVLQRLYFKMNSL